MTMECLNIERENLIQQMKEAGEQLAKMVKHTNGSYILADTYKCTNIVEDVDVQVIDCGTYSVKEMTTHTHTASKEILIVLSGRFKVNHNKKEYVLGKGDIISIPKNEKHACQPLTMDTRVLAVLIPPEVEYSKFHK